MTGDLATLVSDVSPYVTAAVSAYGGAVLGRLKDQTADATVGLGRRILQRIFGHHDEGELPAVVAELAAARMMQIVWPRCWQKFGARWPPIPAWHMMCGRSWPGMMPALQWLPARVPRCSRGRPGRMPLTGGSHSGRWAVACE